MKHCTFGRIVGRKEKPTEDSLDVVIKYEVDDVRLLKEHSLLLQVEKSINYSEGDTTGSSSAGSRAPKCLKA
jgi:hypothetical protein